MATTILWVGGEDIDFSKLGQTSYDQNTNHIRTVPGQFARGAVGVSGTTAGVNANALGNATSFTASSTLWFHCQSFYVSVGNNQCTPSIAFTDASGVQRFQVNVTNNNVIQLVKQDGAGHSTSLVTGVANPAFNQLAQIDVAITIGSGNGSFAYYQGGAGGSILASFSGNTLTDNQTNLTGFVFAGQGNAQATWISEVIVANNDTRSLSLCTGIASGLGNTNTWTVNGGSSAWQNVSQWVTSNNINIAVATSSQLAEFGVSSLTSGAWAINAVVTSAFALAGTSGGPQHMAHVVRTASTDFSGASQTLGASLANTQQVWQTNPATGNNWQQSDITNPAFNFGVVSEP